MTDVSVERILKITPEVQEAVERLAPQLGSSNQVTLTTEYVEQMVANRDNAWLMARRVGDSRLIGMASLLILRVPTNMRASLEAVVVDKATRGSGAGTALCLEARDIAAEYGVNTLRAAALKTNQASRRMLERAGFVLVDEHDYFELGVLQGPQS